MSQIMMILTLSAASVFIQPEMMGCLLLAILFFLMSMLPSIGSTYYFSEVLFLDKVSLMLIFLTILIFLMMPLNSMLFKFNYLSKKSMLMSLLFFVLLFVFTTSKPLLFYMMFELSLVPIFLIIMGWGYQIERLSAGAAMIMYTVTASLPLMVVVFYVNQALSSMSFVSLGLIMTTSCPIKTVFSLMTMAGFLVKFPIFLGHLWLPKAHVEAPASGSMILAAVLLKLGGYGMVRFSELIVSADYFYIILLSLWGGVISSMICVQNLDMKIVVAYSSVAHMAIVIAAISTLSNLGLTGGVIMMIAHGLSSSGLFFYVGLMTKYSNSRSLIMNKGLTMVSPYSSMIWFVIVSSGMGVPPTLNFVAEVSSMVAFIPDFCTNMVMGGVMVFLAGAYSLILYSVPTHSMFYLQSVKKSSYLVGEKLIGLIHGMWVFILLLFIVVMS